MATRWITSRSGSATAYSLDRYDYLKGEQERLRPADRYFWNDPTYPQLPIPPNTTPNVPSSLPVPAGTKPQ